jgi:hypothetical protein
MRALLGVGELVPYVAQHMQIVPCGIIDEAHGA